MKEYDPNKSYDASSLIAILESLLEPEKEKTKWYEYFCCFKKNIYDTSF